MKKSSAWWIRIPVIFFIILGLTEFFIDSGHLPAIMTYPEVGYFMLFVLLLLIGIELILNSIENVMFQTLSKEAQERYLLARDKKWEWPWAKNLLHKLWGSKPIAEEGEIILDHNYDGIQELDNNLPPWWTYLFYATAIFAVIYLLRYEVFNGENQIEEYEKNVAEAQIAIEAYKKTATDLVDANTVEQLTDEADIKAGQAIFQANCVACHMPDGGGGIGPNLTDDNWILGGGIKNIFHTVSEGGRAGKGMIAWKQSLKPKEIAQVSSYVITLHGTTPANPKAPEGDRWEEK
jgi:cytochrome c oxidase cbb3-type subunit 3